jgi:hypothetical protein
VVSIEPRQGKGWVVRRMFRDIDADVYVMVDGDDTYPVDQAMALRDIVASGAADMATGDRMSSTYLQENERPLHGAGNMTVRFLVNRLFGSSLNDVMTGARCFNRTFVKSFPITSPGFEIETEMTIHALDHGFTIVEVPIEYRNRGIGSESKLQTVPDGVKVLRTIAVLFRDYRPLPFFAAVSGLILVMSIVLFMRPFDEYLTTGMVRTFPTLIVAAALGIGSLLSLACGVLLESIRMQARRFYELSLNMNAELQQVRRECAAGTAGAGRAIGEQDIRELNAERPE